MVDEGIRKTFEPNGFARGDFPSIEGASLGAGSATEISTSGRGSESHSNTGNRVARVTSSGDKKEIGQDGDRASLPGLVHGETYFSEHIFILAHAST